MMLYTGNSSRANLGDDNEYSSLRACEAIQENRPLFYDLSPGLLRMLAMTGSAYQNITLHLRVCTT